MAHATQAARRALVWLTVILVAGGGLLAFGVVTDRTGAAPELALDLAGGRQIILSPVTTDGSEVDEADLQQAVEVIRRRVDASGVAEAEITTQGQNIVVALPGTPDDATRALIQQSAQLQFRPVIEVALGSSVSTPASDATADSGTDAETSATPTPSPSASETSFDRFSASEESSTTPSPSPSASVETTTVETTDAVTDTDGPSSYSWATEELTAEFAALDCTVAESFTGGDTGDPDTGFVACGIDGYKYLMGPVELDGAGIETANFSQESTSTGGFTGRYQVNLFFTNDGGDQFYETTSRLATLASPRDQFAIVLDGVVISAPSVEQGIAGGEARITGTYTAESAESLANQIKFGALPLSLEVQSDNQVSATLGADQLRAGLIAGGIGLILVVIYSLFQYRALSLLTVGSLVIAGTLTYLSIALLSWGLDYRLSLAGVTGLIVAIGITADSFIVYFERVRDELREGRSLPAAVDHAWKRARRTILASDAVSLLAAITLYTLAVGGVRGFAFTLGLTTVIDVLVVFLFTHPMLVLLSKTKFFAEGHKFSGLDPKTLGVGARYKGRGRVVTQGEAMTLAERKAAARAAEREQQDAELSAKEDA